MSELLVSTYELAQSVARVYELKVGANHDKKGFMHKTVLKVLSIFGKFVSHSFKKEGY
jgi:hypothetical protein